MADWTDPTVVTAGFSAVAAFAAAVAAWRSPLSAARMAEELRKSGDEAADSRRFRLSVFTTLMQERSEIYSIEAVRAFNSIDVVFSKALKVRKAWAELYLALDQKPVPPNHVIDERLRNLLREMAADLGISTDLRLDDLGRVYVPNALAQERSVRDIRRRREYESVINAAAEAQGGEVAVNWPPAPTA